MNPLCYICGGGFDADDKPMAIPFIPGEQKHLDCFLSLDDYPQQEDYKSNAKYDQAVAEWQWLSGEGK